MSSKIKVYVGLDTVDSKNLGCQLVSHQIRKILNNKSDIDSVYYDSAFDSSLSLKDIDVLRNSDIVYINGEGACNGSMAPNVRSVLDKSIKYKKPIYFSNFTFDPRPQFGNNINKDSLNQWMSYFSLCKKVSVRDPISYVFLKNNGLSNVLLAPDIGTSYYNQEDVEVEVIV